MKRAALLIFLLLWPAAARAQEPPQLMLPTGCALGQDCWIVNYVDMDEAGGSAQDFRCGPLTYDGHEGTDIGIRDLAAMEKGINVLAAAGGTVLRGRDEIADRAPSPEDIEKMMGEKRGCGNGVLIDHGGGWQTIYCHMKQGSVIVKPGQKVRTGEAVGRIGQSGIAEFPHLHFGVFRDGKTIDPFTGRETGGACGAEEEKPLWRPELKVVYTPFSFYGGGFAAGIPDFERIKEDAASPEKIPAAALQALTFWAAFYGAAKDDKIHMEIIGPDGEVLAARDIIQEKTRARQFYYVGKKIGDTSVLPGTYTGKAVLGRVTGEGETLRGEITKTLIID